jgi:uncharacterized membrane protein
MRFLAERIHKHEPPQSNHPKVAAMTIPGNLWAAAILFVVLHVAIPSTPLRPALIRALGANAYRGLFAMAALATLAWLCIAYAQAPAAPVWVTPDWALPVVSLLSFAGLILIVASAGVPNPTAGQPIEGAYAVTGVLRITRNPQLWGIAAIAFGHLVVIGDGPTLVFFGAMLALAAGGSFLLDCRLDGEGDPRWAPFAAATSNVPFLAIARGRQPLDLSFIRAKTVAVAFAAGLVLYLLHPLVRAGYALL